MAAFLTYPSVWHYVHPFRGILKELPPCVIINYHIIFWLLVWSCENADDYSCRFWNGTICHLHDDARNILRDMQRVCRVAEAAQQDEMQCNIERIMQCNIERITRQARKEILYVSYFPADPLLRWSVHHQSRCWEYSPTSQWLEERQQCTITCHVARHNPWYVKHCFAESLSTKRNVWRDNPVSVAP